MKKLYLFAGAYFCIAILILTAGFYITVKYKSANKLICTNVDQKTVLGQTTRPALPDLVKNEGGNINIDPISVIVNDQTFPYDIYLYSREIKKNNPVEKEQMWQVTDSYQLYFKSFFNEAIIIDPNGQFIIFILYY